MKTLPRFSIIVSLLLVGGLSFAQAGFFTTSQIPGTAATVTGVTDGSDATAGLVGELITGITTSGNAIALSTGVTKTIVSVNLSAGDWDCGGVSNFTLTGVTSTGHTLGISLSTNTLPPQPGGSGLASDPLITLPMLTTVLSGTLNMVISAIRVSVNATTAVFLVAQASFTLGTDATFGTLRCRRMR